jgi:hypothetical protein
MSTEHIVSLLIEERDRLEAAISALQGPSSAPAGISEGPTMPDWVKPKGAPARKKRGMSAATRRKMAEGQKRRWAAINAAKAEAIAPSEDSEFKKKMSAAIKKTPAKTAPAKAPVKKGGLTEAGRKALSLAMKKRWAAKKKAAAKKVV